MSEGVSAVFGSNQPFSLKRHRAEDVDSDRSTGRSGCGYAGCGRPAGRLDHGLGTPSRFCSLTHRDFFMADLYDMIKSGGAHGTEQPSGICKLPGCPLAVWVINSTTGEAFDFCRRAHALKYKEDVTERWELEGQLCKFEPCFNHRNVEETPMGMKIHDYCSRDHAFAAAAARGKQAAAAKRKRVAAAKGVSFIPRDLQILEVAAHDGGKDPSSSDEIRQQNSISQEALQQHLQAKIERERGYNEGVSTEAIEKCLSHLDENPYDFENSDPNLLFCILDNGTDFHQIHPFEDVTEFGGFRPKYYLHYIDGAPGGQRSTKQGFTWKRSSTAHENKSGDQRVQATYSHYRKSGMADSKDDYSDGYVKAYLQDNFDRKEKRVKKGTGKRWRRTEFSLNKEYKKGELRRQIAVISKVSQDKKGTPVWPPLPQKKETRDMGVIAAGNKAPAPVGIVAETTIHAEERGTTSSVSSEASSLAGNADLYPWWDFLQGGHSNEFEESCTFISQHLEAIANESNALVAVGNLPAEKIQEERDMTGSTSSNTALGEDVAPMSSDYNFYDAIFEEGMSSSVYPWRY